MAGGRDEGRGDARMREVFLEYVDTCSTEGGGSRMKARLAVLSAHADAQGLTGQAAFDSLHRLSLELRGELMDMQYFSLFYRFVFFMCRERGQKNISVATATEAWRLALKGRFRLLDQWCAFVPKYQKYAISEDTWRQVLDFSRSVHEDLSNYDPQGAWPVLIDEFVEYMFKRAACGHCSGTRTEMCECDSMQFSSSFSSTPASQSGRSSVDNRGAGLHGVIASAGSKRRWRDPKEEAAQMASVNSIVQKMADMNSPESQKRARSESLSGKQITFLDPPTFSAGANFPHGWTILGMNQSANQNAPGGNAGLAERGVSSERPLEEDTVMLEEEVDDVTNVGGVCSMTPTTSHNDVKWFQQVCPERVL